MNAVRPWRLAAVLAAAAVLIVLAGRHLWTLGLLDGLSQVHPPLVSGRSPVPERERCSECHETVADLHRRGPHSPLVCEECHGALEAHVSEGERAPAMSEQGSITRLCSRCHRELRAARKGTPKINLEAHVVEVGALFSDSVCFDCHLPHDPRP